MSARLKDYIKKIEAGQPINYSAFLGVLERMGISQVSATALINVTKQGRSPLYRVDSINEDFLKQIKSKVTTKTTTRAVAAQQNNSHAVRVNGSYILRRTGLGHPVVVVIDSEGNFTPATNNQRTLVIENRQNFLSIEHTSTFLQQLCGIEITDEWDVLFGAGGEINNHLHERYLSQYSCVFMLLDLDIGGLNIAKTLATRTPLASHRFVLPTDISMRLKAIKEVATQEVIETAFLIGRSAPFLSNAAQYIVTHRKTLEQESYIV
mgnify:CR=1 FL=1